MLPAGDQDEVEMVSASASALVDGRNYRPKHAELIVIINKIIILASSWLFILLNIQIFVTLYF